MNEHPRNVCTCVCERKKENEMESPMERKEIHMIGDDLPVSTSFGLNGAQKQPALSSWAGYIIWNHVWADSSAFSLDMYTLFMNIK